MNIDDWADDVTRRCGGVPIGYPLLTEQNYDRMVQSFADRSEWPATFGEHIALQEKQLAALRKRGLRVIPVVIDDDDFTRWREAHGFTEINPDARTTFCAYKATEHTE